MCVIAQGLGITLFPGPPHEPQVRGIVERFHETLDTRLWATLHGYVGPNVVERNPGARAELTLAEVEQRFRSFIDRYHQEIHSATGQTPLAFWQEHATPLPVNERLSYAFFPDAPPSAQEATLTTFFAQVTQPMAEMIERLYVSPLLRRVLTVEEIMRRMAHRVGASALPLDVVTGVCCSFGRRRASILSGDAIQMQATTWRIGWQQTAIQVRTLQRTTTPFLLLVIDEATDNVLAFRSTQDCPRSADVLSALYDALVFSRQDRWCLHPPARLRVQQPVPPEVIQAAKTWGTEVEAVAQHEFAFVQRWEQELTGRVLDPIQYLRIVDRACERAGGYAPFLAKQQAARQAGWRMRLDDDPCRFLPSLRELLPADDALVGRDGTLEWHGWHYRDIEDHVLRYWPGEAVTIRPSPMSEAVIWVYWGQDVLCQAVAEELCHKDGSFRPYWFPYPRLGE